MVQVPDYSGLEAQWQTDCHNWNANITAINHRLPALSNPPAFVKLFQDGYYPFKDLKAASDQTTTSAGWLTVVHNSKPKKTLLATGHQPPRKTRPQQSRPTANGGRLPTRLKRRQTKWKLVIQEGGHSHQGPQEVPEAQRGWAKLSEAHRELTWQST